mgnify:CR=1 FL=1
MATKKFWKIAVYRTDRLLGGQEEGGWYYDAGDRIKEGKIEYTDPKKAYRACRLFNKLFGSKGNSIEYGIECDVYYRGTPESFPQHTPYYS